MKLTRYFLQQFPPCMALDEAALNGSVSEAELKF